MMIIRLYYSLKKKVFRIRFQRIQCCEELIVRAQVHSFVWNSLLLVVVVIVLVVMVVIGEVPEQRVGRFPVIVLSVVMVFMSGD